MKGDLRTLLLSQSSITSIVGTSGVFVTDAKQGAPLPYAVISQTDSDEFNTLDAPSGSFRSLEIEIESKGRTAEEADRLSETIRGFLKDYSGAAGTQVIDAVIVEGQFESKERPVNGSDQKTFVVTLELTVQYHPS